MYCDVPQIKKAEGSERHRKECAEELAAVQKKLESKGAEVQLLLDE